MKLDVTVALKNLDGESLVDVPGGKALSLRQVLKFALLNSDAGQDGEEKFRRFKLAERIHDHDCVEMTVEEAAMLKRLVGATATTVAVGMIYPLLDG